MTELTVTENKVPTMTSLEIARLTEKEHRNVLRDIREMLSQLGEGNALRFEHVYKDAKGEKRPMFALPERELMILLTGYSVALRAKVIDRWRELEATHRKPQKQTYLFMRRCAKNQHKIPTTHFSALNQINQRLFSLMEVQGYILPDNLMPDISLGKIFSNWLRKEGHDPDSFPTYLHEFDDGVRPSVTARLYPNELLSDFNKAVDDWVKSGKAEKYFSERDKGALEPLKTVLLQVENQKVVALPRRRSS